MEVSENEGYWVKTLGMQGDMDGFMEKVAELEGRICQLVLPT